MIVFKFLGFIILLVIAYFVLRIGLAVFLGALGMVAPLAGMVCLVVAAIWCYNKVFK